MKRIQQMIIIISFALITVSGCQKDDDKKNITDLEDESTDQTNNDADERECSLYCDSGDVCNGIALSICMTIYTIKFPICIAGRLIDCQTPANSECCPGYGQEKIDLGECTNSVNYCQDGGDFELE